MSTIFKKSSIPENTAKSGANGVFFKNKYCVSGQTVKQIDFFSIFQIYCWNSKKKQTAQNAIKFCSHCFSKVVRGLLKNWQSHPSKMNSDGRGFRCRIWCWWNARWFWLCGSWMVYLRFYLKFDGGGRNFEHRSFLIERTFESVFKTSKIWSYLTPNFWGRWVTAVSVEGILIQFLTRKIFEVVFISSSVFELSDIRKLWNFWNFCFRSLIFGNIFTRFLRRSEFQLENGLK